MKTLSKEIFVMALLLLAVVFSVGTFFYQYMPNNKTVPEPITYSADRATTSVLQEISATSSQGSTGGGSAEVESVIKSYSIGTKDLSTAASKQSYTSGKTNPFAEAADDTNTVGNTNGGGTSATGNNTDSYKTENTIKNSNSNSNSTGTFFEKENSK